MDMESGSTKPIDSKPELSERSQKIVNAVSGAAGFLVDSAKWIKGILVTPDELKRNEKDKVVKRLGKFSLRLFCNQIAEDLRIVDTRDMVPDGIQRTGYDNLTVVSGGRQVNILSFSGWIGKEHRVGPNSNWYETLEQDAGPSGAFNENEEEIRYARFSYVPKIDEGFKKSLEEFNNSKKEHNEHYRGLLKFRRRRRAFVLAMLAVATTGAHFTHEANTGDKFRVESIDPFNDPCTDREVGAIEHNPKYSSNERDFALQEYYRYIADNKDPNKYTSTPYKKKYCPELISDLNLKG